LSYKFSAYVLCIGKISSKTHESLPIYVTLVTQLKSNRQKW